MWFLVLEDLLRRFIKLVSYPNIFFIIIVLHIVFCGIAYDIYIIHKKRSHIEVKGF